MNRMMGWVVAIATCAGPAGAQTLHVYGPGGPAAPLRECAALFEQRAHIHVEITAGPEPQWIDEAARDADVVYGGAEYMLTDFGTKHPGFLADGTRTELYRRGFAILVRKGNPKGIRRMQDLAQPGVKILDVSGAGQVGAWEDIAGREDLIAGIERNMAGVAPNTAEGLKLWAARPDLDAWITFASWGKVKSDAFTVVPLPERDQIYRGTPVALAARTTQRAEADAFVKFLQTPEAHAVFVRWGWK
jgi:accessory colonization factor AcfC